MPLQVYGLPLLQLDCQNRCCLGHLQPWHGHDAGHDEDNQQYNFLGLDQVHILWLTTTHEAATTLPAR